MNHYDETEQQTLGELGKAERMSLQATVPPAQIPGYRIERLLGQGAFGQVWVGRDLNTGRQVAVKFYLHRGGVNWALLSREVKHLVSMSANRHIVQVLEVGWEAEPPYYVMEFLENGSLEDMLRRNGTLSVSHAVSIFQEIATGLNHSHGKGVLHCDLKPANILLDQDFRPRLADFGQSRMSHEQTPSLGTLFYMAPEQADLQAIPDARWDVYALGAILYATIVGLPPHRTSDSVKQLDTASSLPERLQRYRDCIMNSPPPRQHYRARGMDRALGLIIDQCLAKKPEQRFANVQQVQEALQRRQLGRMRRPLLLLGIVGPLLLMALMAGFSVRSILVAENESMARLQQRALQSNQFAAAFAARTLESEIEGLFRLVENEAERPACQTRLKSTLVAQAEVLPKLMVNDYHDVVGLRNRFLAAPDRVTLDQYFETRLAGLRQEAEANNQPARFSSLFVTDRHGTVVGAAFEEAVASDQLATGKNFAFRSYFTGLRNDLPVDSPRSEIQSTSYTHLSSPFQSTTTGRWKVAISTPILEQLPENVEGPRQPIGVLVLTINLGGFELLSANLNEDPDERMAVLVDGRSDGDRGTILQHPLLERLDRDQQNQSRGKPPQFQVDDNVLDRLTVGGIIDYEDPLSKHPLGERYTGTWIAAAKRVDLPKRIPGQNAAVDRAATDLWVLVQERSNSLTEPIRELGQQLEREGIIAAVTFICVMLILWYFVIAVLRSPTFKPGEKIDGPKTARSTADEPTIEMR